jgi:hypothetical protein
MQNLPGKNRAHNSELQPKESTGIGWNQRTDIPKSISHIPRYRYNYVQPMLKARTIPQKVESNQDHPDTKAQQGNLPRSEQIQTDKLAEHGRQNT